MAQKRKTKIAGKKKSALLKQSVLSEAKNQNQKISEILKGKSTKNIICRRDLRIPMILSTT